MLKEMPQRINKSGRSYRRWLCQCDCGNQIEVDGSALLSSNQVSCGCYQKEKAREIRSKHKMADTRPYQVWRAMKSRCFNKNDHNYSVYGARGITVCDEWKDDFMAFYDWALDNGYKIDAPRGQCTVDRIDGNKGYSPENCRIITQSEQAYNLRTNRNITYNGETHCIAEWGKILGIDACKLRNRITNLGWSTERAFNTP